MRERPILFSDAMVRAIIAGQKTQTRRLVKPAPGKQSEWLSLDFITKVPSMRMCRVNDGTGRFGAQMEHPGPGGGPGGWVHCPFYDEEGLRMRVREAWRVSDESEADICYRATGTERRFLSEGDAEFWKRWGAKSEHGKWCPSIFMPAWASRITLDVTHVRVERLQAITEDDARAEGVDVTAPTWTPEHRIGWADGSRRDAFRALWDSINGERAPWSLNPWVWVVRFRVTGSEPGCSPREAADDAENLNDSEAGYRSRTGDIQLGKQARSR